MNDPSTYIYYSLIIFLEILEICYKHNNKHTPFQHYYNIALVSAGVHWVNLQRKRRQSGRTLQAGTSPSLCAFVYVCACPCISLFAVTNRKFRSSSGAVPRRVSLTFTVVIVYLLLHLIYLWTMASFDKKSFICWPMFLF